MEIMKNEGPTKGFPDCTDLETVLGCTAEYVESAGDRSKRTPSREV
jgi:hypothetical protein